VKSSTKLKTPYLTKEELKIEESELITPPDNNY